VGSAEELIGRRRTIEDHGDDLEDGRLVAEIARQYTTELHEALLSGASCCSSENGAARRILRTIWPWPQESEKITVPKDRWRLGVPAHINLKVLGVPRSAAFYGRWLGFGPEDWRSPDGTVFVRDAEGTDLAFQPGQMQLGLSSMSHFGFRRSTPAEVCDLHANLTGHGVPVAEFEDEPQLVTVKFTDPDGYLVQAYWEL
jgi:catechol 2,3-dioxygenase-like lactoylglutathione lyase family enzyme